MASDTSSDTDMEVDTGNFQLLLPLLPLEPLENTEFDEDFPSDDDIDQLMRQVNESEGEATREANDSVNCVNDQQNTEPGGTVHVHYLIMYQQI